MKLLIKKSNCIFSNNLSDKDILEIETDKPILFSDLNQEDKINNWLLIPTKYSMSNLGIRKECNKVPCICTFSNDKITIDGFGL